MPVLLLGVERVGVGLGDDADAGPAGVAEHRGPAVGRGQGQGQQGVVADGRPQRRGVVAELADLGGRLVDEAEATPGRGAPPRTRTADRRPGRQEGPTGLCEVQAVAAHQQVQPGRVPAPDLQAVERGQGDLDRPPAVQRVGRHPSGRRSATPRAIPSRSRSMAHQASLRATRATLMFS